MSKRRDSWIVRRALILVALILPLGACYHSVPTREPDREIWKIRLTNGEEFELPRRHHAYWQDTVVVIEQHANDADPRIIPASQIVETWTREVDSDQTEFLGWMTAGVVVLVFFLGNLQAPT